VAGVMLAALALPVAASAEVTAVQIGTFTGPTYVTGAPGAPALLFVAERGGRIAGLDDEVPDAQPFLDISDIVLAPGDPGADAEQGLLSIAFPADYPDTRRFYVYFTNNEGNIEIDEFRTSATDPTRANRNSRRQVIVIGHPFAQNHNGGQMHFGPNGRLLYFATGDGGAGQRANAPDLTSLLGKLIRIDPRQHGDLPYRIPASNPYVGRGGRDEIFAYGLRNPWRWSFDFGRIVIGDVGARTWEEIDALRLGDTAGVNFGWPEYEGFEVLDPTLPGPDPPTFPVHVYSHDGGGCAITGGYVVRDPGLPELFGRYLYADFCLGELRSLRVNFSTGEAVGDRPVGVTAPPISTFGEGAGGQIYFARLSGEVYRLEQTSP
jgi:glucose/arabinose dehydrogenase